MGKAGNLSLAEIAHEAKVEELASLYGSEVVQASSSPCESPLISQFVFYAVHLARSVVECKCICSFIETAKKE